MTTPYWHAAIAVAKQRREEGLRPYFSDKDVDKAYGWTTCACGEQDARIPRREDSAPVDDQLRSLGLLFCRYVTSDSIDSAEATLQQIEGRAAELLKELA